MNTYNECSNYVLEFVCVCPCARVCVLRLSFSQIWRIQPFYLFFVYRAHGFLFCCCLFFFWLGLNNDWPFAGWFFIVSLYIRNYLLIKARRCFLDYLNGHYNTSALTSISWRLYTVLQFFFYFRL